MFFQNCLHGIVCPSEYSSWEAKIIQFCWCFKPRIKNYQGLRVISGMFKHLKLKRFYTELNPNFFFSLTKWSPGIRGLHPQVPKELEVRRLPLQVQGCFFWFVTGPAPAHSLVPITDPAPKAFELVMAHHQPGLCVRTICEAFKATGPRALAKTLWIGSRAWHLHRPTASQAVPHAHHLEPLAQDKVPTYLNNTE